MLEAGARRPRRIHEPSLQFFTEFLAQDTSVCRSVKPDSASGHQLNDATTAFHFDSARIPWIQADHHTLSAHP
ncbi:MAG: hypothetical protein ACLQLO_27590, partial [Mycobacterium sp.]